MKILNKRGLLIAIAVFVCWMVCSHGEAVAQTTWSRTYGIDSDWHGVSINAIEQTFDGGYILAGFKSYLGNGINYYGLIIKIDSTGRITWQREYQTMDYFTTGMIVAIKQTSDCGYIAAGIWAVYDYEAQWILRLDSDGNVLWQKPQWINEDGSSSKILDLLQTKEGDSIVIGYVGHNNGDRNLIAIKFDSLGNLLWKKEFHSDLKYLYYGKYSIDQTNDGNYVIASNVYNDVLSHVLVMKLDTLGNPIWQSRYGDPNSTAGLVASSIRHTNDGGSIVSGVIWSIPAVGLIMKLDADGNIEWQKSYSIASYTGLSSIQQTSDNCYIASGYTDYNSNSSDAWVMKLNENGSIIWQKSYGGADADDAKSVKQTNDSGYIVLAHTCSFSQAYGCPVWLIKMDSNGEMDSSCSFSSNINAVVANTSLVRLPFVNEIIDPVIEEEVDYVFPGNPAIGDSLLCTTPIELISHKMQIDDSGSSTPNGIIEPDELVHIIGTLENIGASPATGVSGSLNTISPIEMLNSYASYPDIATGSSSPCSSCYSIIAPESSRPGLHWDIYLWEAPHCNECSAASFGFTYHVGGSFSDVPASNMFYPYVETLLHSGITSGCTSSAFCPNSNVNRKQFAKMICNSMNKMSPGSCSSRTPSVCAFWYDMDAMGIFYEYIDGLCLAGLMLGCQADPPLFCPDADLQRQSMAKVLCQAMETVNPGSCSINPACAGIFNDVGPDNLFCPYIEALHNASVTSGCTSSSYCPLGIVTRAQMAKFIVRGFGLSL